MNLGDDPIVIVVVFYFCFYIVMQKCNFLSIVISFARNTNLLPYYLLGGPGQIWVCHFLSHRTL